MNRIAKTSSLALVIFALSACGSNETTDNAVENTDSEVEETPSATPSPEEDTPTAEEPDQVQLDAELTAEALQSAVETITDYTVITEDNDPNDLIGRPNGYAEAVVIYDSAAECEDLSIDCGATVEFWADEDAATGRSDYIQDILAEAPLLGSEYHFQQGSMLLRVAGQLTPSQSETYEAAFEEVTN